MTEALTRKFSTARRELSWQYLFPNSRLVKNPQGEELLDHASVETTQIYTYVMKKPFGIISPLDRL